jgi:hypothetical protein
MAIVVDAMVVVELVDVELALLDKVVVADHDTGQRAHETGIARKESEKAGSILDNVPGRADNAEERDEQCGAEDVDVLGAETGNIVREGVCTSCNLVADGGEHEREACKELGGSRVEFGNDGWHVPLKFAPEVGVGTCHENPVLLVSVMIRL